MREREKKKVTCNFLSALSYSAKVFCSAKKCAAFCSKCNATQLKTVPSTACTFFNLTLNFTEKNAFLKVKY